MKSRLCFEVCVCLGFFNSELLICISKLQIKVCDERTLQIMVGGNCICFLCMDGLVNAV